MTNYVTSDDGTTMRPERPTHAHAFPSRPLTDDEWAAARIAGVWTPTTLAAAEWTAQRLSEAVDELDAIKMQVADYVDAVRGWANEMLKAGRGAELTADIEFFEAALRSYARNLRDQSIDRKGEPRVKTVKLPSATLETKKAAAPKPKFIVVDMDALVKWAEEAAPDAIVRTVDVSKLKLLVITNPDEAETVIDSDGEVVPGIDWDIDPPKDTHVIIRLHREGQR